MYNKSLDKQTEDDVKALLEAFETQQESINAASSRLFEAVGDKIRRLKRSVSEENAKSFHCGLGNVVHHAEFSMGASENITDHVNKGIAQIKNVLNENEEIKAKEKAQENAEAREKAKATSE